MQAGQAIVEVDHGAGLTFFTPYRRTRVVVIGLTRLPAVVFTSLLPQELLLVLIRLGALEHADGLHVLLDNITDLGDDRWSVTPALFKISSLWVKHAVHFVNQEGDVSTLAKHRRQNPRQGDDPLEMFHIF